ncbi:MAG: PA14 domain-containing protein [Ferruginibacter sp.]
MSNNVFKARWTGKLRPLTNDSYTFYTVASDGVRLWVNNQLIIDSWTDKNTTTNSGTISLQQNTDYDIRLEYYSNTASANCILQWSANGICKQNIPTSQLIVATAQCSSNGTGLMASYFSNTAAGDPFPATPTLTDILTDVNFDWAGGSPAGISNDDFKARFTGYVQTLDAGTYTFYLTGDDGIRLWVNDQLVIDEWVDQSATEYSVNVNLPKSCHKYAIKVEYYENGGDAVCRLDWSGPTIARQPIPLTQLYTQPDVDPVIPPDTTTTNPGSTIPQEFLVLPNPARTDAVVHLKAGFTAGDVISVYNMLGQKVIKKVITGSNSGTEVKIKVEQLASGMYVVKLVHGGKKYKAKLMVTR